MLNRSTCAILLGFTLVVAAEANWPQWRGPEFHGSSPSAKNLALSWSRTDNVLWRTKLPSWSAATPIVWGDTIFVTSAEEGFTPLDRGRRSGASQNPPDKIFLVAINRKDGAIRWRKPIDSGNQLFNKQNSASPSPVTDGNRVWTM